MVPGYRGSGLMCFFDIPYLVGVCDNRISTHATNPFTRWIVSETDYGRKLKIMYVPRKDGIHIKSAYDATTQIEGIYMRNAKPL